MNDLDIRLSALREAIAQRNVLTGQEAALMEHIAALEQELAQREQTYTDEQADVDKLEEPSLKGLFLDLAGLREKALAREQEEALAAGEQRDAAAHELDVARADLERLRRELAFIPDRRQEHADLVAKKAEALKQTGSPAAARLLELERAMARLDEQQTVLQEAAVTAEQALGCARELQDLLNVASTIALNDLWPSFDFRSKYETLEQAKQSLCLLQPLLDDLNGKQDDAVLHIDLQLEMGERLRTMDRHNSTVGEVIVSNKIDTACAEVRDLRRQIAALRGRLNERIQAAGEELARIRTEWGRLAEETPL